MSQLSAVSQAGPNDLPHALLVIDVQEAMFAPTQQPPVYRAEETVKRIGELLTKARAAGARVIYIQHHDRHDPNLQPEAPGFAIRAAITPQPGETVVVKRICDSFAETNLEQVLRDDSIERLVTCGIQSEFCVDACTRGAMNRGFAAILASDAHTSWDNGVLSAELISANVNATLPNMSGVGPNIRVLTTAEIDFTAPAY
jgi:nicotinamidase-related amidase